MQNYATHSKIMLLGFEKNVKFHIMNVFPDIEVIDISAGFSLSELETYSEEVKAVFINGVPDIYLDLMQKDSHIQYPGNNLIRYCGPKILNLQYKLKLFKASNIYVFNLPRIWHIGNLDDIAKITGSTLHPEKDDIAKITGSTLQSTKEKKYSIAINFEQKNYLAAFIFARLFSFLPAPYIKIKNDKQPAVHKQIEIGNLLESLEKIRINIEEIWIKGNKCERNYFDLYDEIQIFEFEIYAKFDYIHKFTALNQIPRSFFEERSFKDTEYAMKDSIDNPFKDLYPVYTKRHIHKWLEKKPSNAKRFERHPDLKDYPVRHLKNNCSNVFLLPPPETMEDILLPIYIILKNQEESTGKPLTNKHLKTQHENSTIIGKSTALELLFRQITPTLGDQTGHILILGEAGTGKELVAKIIMDWQNNWQESINCSHLPYNLALSILFGHTKGAFTGAETEKTGYIKEKRQGSLFMDEIQALSEEVVPMLLRYLESGEFVKLGENKTRKATIRIIAACNDDTIFADKFLSNGFLSRFRYIIRVPSLKYRTTDIPLLIDYFTRKAKKDLHLTENKKLMDHQVEILKTADWQHSNVRGVKNAVYNILARSHKARVGNPTKTTETSGRKKSLSDKTLLKYMRSALIKKGSTDFNPSKKLKEALKNHMDLSIHPFLSFAETNKKKKIAIYQTQASMRQRIRNAKEFGEELKKLFEDNFAKNY